MLLSMILHRFDLEFAPSFDVAGFPDIFREYVSLEMDPLKVKLGLRPFGSAAAGRLAATGGCDTAHAPGSSGSCLEHVEHDSRQSC